MGRLTDAEYASLGEDIEHNPIRAEEIDEVYIAPEAMRPGRPSKASGKSGETPAMSVRLPRHLRSKLDARADSDHVAPAEVIRRALAAYLNS